MSVSVEHLRAWRPTALAVVLAGAAVGCGAADGDVADTAVVRDSAGIRIVENNAARWAPREEWRVESEPEVEIGVVDGDPAYRFGGIGSLLLLSDGRIVVADRGSAEIRYFMADGEHLRTIGGRGEGPGEFGRDFVVHRLPGDSLVAWDFHLNRGTVFDDAGRLARTFRLSLDGTDYIVPRVVHALADGTLVSAVSLGAARSSLPDEWQWTAFLRHASTGELLDTIGEFPMAECSPGPGCGIVPFGAVATDAASGTRLFIGDPADYEISVYGPDGTLERLIRKRHDHLPITPADVEAYGDALLQQAPEARRPAAERFMAETGFPDRMPAFASMLVDDAGRLWVEEFTEVRNTIPTLPGAARKLVDDRPVRAVFDVEGEYLGTVAMPRRLVARHIRGDRVVGVYRDELDVEYVRVHRISRGRPQ